MYNRLSIAINYSYSESVIYHREAALMSIPRIVEVMAQELGWSSERCQQETRDSIAFMQSFGGSRPLQHHGNIMLRTIIYLSWTIYVCMTLLYLYFVVQNCYSWCIYLLYISSCMYRSSRIRWLVSCSHGYPG